MYKLHALGDYPQTIRERGTTDNYTSQWVRSTMALFYQLAMSDYCCNRSRWSSLTAQARVPTHLSTIMILQETLAMCSTAVRSWGVCPDIIHWHKV